ncbi:MATE family efflux transporter [Minwuia thermotolerans]|nr:MATE family efflux transporter [Minwuia thermotolerans]
MSQAETTAAAASGPPEAVSPRTRLLLEGPVTPTLLRLAFPNFGEAAARVAFISFDAVFIGWIGTDALAGVSLVFPIFLLMQTMSASGLGAGTAASIGAALGAGRTREAAGIAAHAVMLALIVAAGAGAIMIGLGPEIFRALGAEGAALEAAVTYSAIVFGGIALVWLMNLTANAVRGMGIMTVPAGAIVAGEAVHLMLSPVLILGLGPFEPMGVVGAAIALLATYGVGALILLVYLFSGRGLFRLTAADFRPARRHFGAILKIGVLASLNTIQLQATFLGLTSLFALFGPAALAGFGAANRLELLQIPITFGVGSAVIAMIATNAGAGLQDRVRAIAWAGCGISALIGLVFAGVAILLPEGWMRLFSDEPAVVAAGAAYLRAMGPTLPVMGFAFGLFFALLGVGSAIWPFLAGALRLALALGVGALVAQRAGGGIDELSLAAAGAGLAFAAAMVLSGRRLLWSRAASAPA